MKATMSEFDEMPTAARIADLQQQIQSLQQQLIQAQKMSSVGVLASSITHEFNNILMTVINYAKMGVRHKDAATRDKAFAKSWQPDIERQKSRPACFRMHGSKGIVEKRWTLFR